MDIQLYMCMRITVHVCILLTVKWILAWFFPVNLRLKLSVFDVMLIYKDLRLHDNTLRRFWIQSLLRLELQVRLELGNPIQYLQLSQNLEHLWSVIKLEGYWIPIQAEFFNGWGPKLRQTIEWVNIIVL